MDPADRYSALGFLYFGEPNPAKRRRALELEAGVLCD